MRKISACTLDCQDTCSTLVTVHPEDNSVSITGNPDHPFTKGFICPKGRRAHRRLSSPRRITAPLIRRGEKFLPIGWDEALNLIAEKITALRDCPATMLHVRHYGYRGVLADGSKYLFNSLGASTTRGALCDEAGCEAYAADFGALEMNDPMDLINARHIINWGKDLSRSSIHLTHMVRQARKKGCLVTTISPGGDLNDTLSDFFIRIRPGRDRFLAAAVIKGILDGNLVHDSVLSRVANFDDFIKVLDGHSISSLLNACDCSTKDLAHLMSVFTGSLHHFEKRVSPGESSTDRVSLDSREKDFYFSRRPPVALIMGWGIQRYKFGGETVRFLNALSFLSGHVGRSGGGTYYNISSGRNINTQWVEQAGKPARTLLLPRIGREIIASDPPIRFLLADGSNFVNQAPDADTTMNAMEKIDFKVVIDAFMTDTARLADVILPCALDYEREEMVGSCLHNWVNHARPVFPPRGKARCDFDIMSDLAGRLGIAFPHRSVIFEKALDTPPMGDFEDPLAEIREKGFIRASYPAIAWKNLVFAHRDGKYRLPTDLNRETEPPPGFPMHLLTLVNKDAMHSQLSEKEHTALEETPHPLEVWINGKSPHLTGIDGAVSVHLVTPLGRMPVTVKTMDSLHPMALVIRRGGWLKHGRCVNRIIEPAITDMGETAAYYSQYARLEKV
ncbi:Anaerobic selenocysteine-containing dehydrogenase [Desulfocicer vacuolatum DSM 3385]|uniref:Anaerobic selenocysteine-containing dehydrogenase n=1 Tax=Desulfocicer vacuolatum DSM 3385 TaxID=1121400 RepID=A0A1W2E7Y3_9BACT|nr:molybdopterin-dependent oxidoreductase [Desulfocicer vacuolatum]SMD05889.1 Anaerobic selenocysteine-containing dehydrogenase [Desulfocicer vacuolatum DSM 3385]